MQLEVASAFLLTKGFFFVAQFLNNCVRSLALR